MAEPTYDYTLTIKFQQVTEAWASAILESLHTAFKEVGVPHDMILKPDLLIEMKGEDV